MDRALIDVRAAARSLLASPGPVVAVVLMLALATGVNAALLGLVSRGLLAPPAFVHAPERVFALGFAGAREADVMTTTSYPAFRAVSEDVPAVELAAAWRRAQSAVMIGADQRRAETMLVTGEYFRLLGVSAASGRTLEPDDDRNLSTPAAVLGHAFWQAAFDADPSALGRRLSISGVEYSVVGIMPRGFGGHSADRTDLWLPLPSAMQSSPGWENDSLRRLVSVIVRVAGDGLDVAAAEQASAALQTRTTLRPIGGASVTAAERRIAFGLAALSVLVLVIALANAATLLLVRGAGRRHDAAVRTALGASRARLLAHAGWEALIIALCAGVLALVFSHWFDDGVRRILLSGVIESGGPGRVTILAAAIASALTWIVAAAAAAAQMPSTGVSMSLAGGNRITGAGRHLQRSLLVVQIAVSVVLLAGLGMFGRSLYNLASQEFGFHVDEVMLVDFPPEPHDARERSELFTDALHRVRAMPGVERATTIQGIPFGSFHVPPISVPGLAEPPGAAAQLPFLIAATPDLFPILGVTMLDGRSFTADDERGAPVVIVNESMARTTWPGERAVGKCIRIGFDPDFDPSIAAGPPVPPMSAPCREVIGVARDIRQRSVLPSEGEDRLMQYYVPFSQVPPPPFAVNEGVQIHGLLVRARGDLDTVAAAVRKAVINGRTDLPFLNVRPYSAIFATAMRPWRLGTQLLAMFAALAVIVAAVGLYAAFAHTVSERRQEMAIRLAIGANRSVVVRLVLRDALFIAAIGTATGAGAATLAGRWAASLMFGTSPTDPLVLVSAAAAMILVAAMATFLPARSAASTNPSDLLRAN